MWKAFKVVSRRLTHVRVSTRTRGSLAMDLGAERVFKYSIFWHISTSIKQVGKIWKNHQHSNLDPFMIQPTQLCSSLEPGAVGANPCGFSNPRDLCRWRALPGGGAGWLVGWLVGGAALGGLSLEVFGGVGHLCSSWTTTCKPSMSGPSGFSIPQSAKKK